MAAHEWLCSKGLDERLSMFPLFPHEVTDDAERVRIAAAASDPELAEHAIALAERRAALNPQVCSCRAAAAHVRGIWFEAARRSRGRGRPLSRWTTPTGVRLGTRGPRPGTCREWRHAIRREVVRRGALCHHWRRGRVGLSPHPRPASPSRRTSSLCGEHSTQDGMGGTHRTRDQRGPLGRRGAHESPDCGCTLCQSAYSEYASPTRLREARDQLEGAVDALRSRAVVLDSVARLDLISAALLCSAIHDAANAVQVSGCPLPFASPRL